MKRRYLTISEFAGLRNVRIGSLRYYEKLKILTPARVDPATNYRYCLPEQLKTLGTIMLCVALDIPLKNLKNYVDEDGFLDEKSILETGKKAMQDKISEMQESWRSRNSAWIRSHGTSAIVSGRGSISGRSRSAI